MKRDGYIIEEIIEWSNLNNAFDTVVRGDERKNSEEGKALIARRDEVLAEIRERIANGTYTVGKYRECDILEGGKIRHIQIFTMYDRIAVNAVMTIVDAHIRRRFIRTTSASIKKRGMHELKEYIERDMRNDPEGFRYIYKFDIRKYYETVKHDFLMYAIEHTFKDKKLIRILEGFVRLMGNENLNEITNYFEEEIVYVTGLRGISIGLRSSQGLGNLLLSVFLDHYLKDRHRIKHYYRYCDDGVIAHGVKLYLWECKGIVHLRVELIGQVIKPNERVFPIEDGLDFLGYVIFPTHSRLRKRVKQSFARKLKRVKSRKRRKELVGSLWGMAKHCNSWNLLRKLLFPSEFNKIKRKKMKDFGCVKIDRKKIGGKKSFRGRNVSGRELERKPFIILDFERDVIPSYEKEAYDKRLEEAATKGVKEESVRKPKPKYVVSVIFNDQLRKFWSGDKDVWDALDSAEEQQCLPAYCSMEVDYSGKYPKFEIVSAAKLNFTMTEEEQKRIEREFNIKL